MVLARCCDGVATVLVPWVSLGLPLYIPYLSLLLPPGFQEIAGVSTGPRAGFGRIGLAVIQGNPHFHAALILSG